MNIIFEGIDAVGKTTLINKLKNYLEISNKKSQIIKEIEELPLKNVLTEMLNKDPFFNSKKNFKTSIYETFLLAADFFYKQEYFRGKKDIINIYDRDFLTILCYQKIILENEYSSNEINDFFDSFSNCLLFKLKKVDLLVYVYVPLEKSLERIKERDNKILNEKEIKFLKLSKNRFEKELIPKLEKNNINIILINGEDSIENNINKIIKKINKEI